MDYLILEDSDSSLRNVGKNLPLYAA